MKMYKSLPRWGKGELPPALGGGGPLAVVGVSTYVSPEIEILNLNNRDIITDSQNQGPDETTQIPSTNGIWDLNNNI